MKILLDCSPAKILMYRERYQVDFWQLRTPLTQYRRASGIPWALENGCFGEFNEEIWLRMLDEADRDRPLFVTLPDIVGDARRTMELFWHFHRRTQELPRALVIQDGIEREDIPWNEIVAVFIGGTDSFKYSQVAMNVAKTARMLKKGVHLGRVNTAKRMRNWLGIADTGDGSGMSRFDHMLEDVLAVLSGEHPQHTMELA